MNCKFCSTPIPDHPAGRCLDAIVAEKLGWKDVSFTYTGASAILIGIDPHTSKKLIVPRFSTDLNEAIKLWEEMSSRKVIGINNSLVKYGNKGTTVYRLEFPSLEKTYYPYADTPALALTRAYLIEKMKEDE